MAGIGPMLLALGCLARSQVQARSSRRTSLEVSGLSQRPSLKTAGVRGRGGWQKLAAWQAGRGPVSLLGARAHAGTKRHPRGLQKKLGDGRVKGRLGLEAPSHS